MIRVAPAATIAVRFGDLVMSRSTVQEILRKIDALPQKDRERLERELAARTEAEWKRLARQARATARRRGIDQAAIDRAVEQVRYGRR
jgi:hypothetical protein